MQAVGLSWPNAIACANWFLDCCLIWMCWVASIGIDGRTKNARYSTSGRLMSMHSDCGIVFRNGFMIDLVSFATLSRFDAQEILESTVDCLTCLIFSDIVIHFLWSKQTHGKN